MTIIHEFFCPPALRYCRPVCGWSTVGALLQNTLVAAVSLKASSTTSRGPFGSLAHPSMNRLSLLPSLSPSSFPCRVVPNLRITSCVWKRRTSPRRLTNMKATRNFLDVFAPTWHYAAKSFSAITSPRMSSCVSRCQSPTSGSMTRVTWISSSRFDRSIICKSVRTWKSTSSL